MQLGHKFLMMRQQINLQSPQPQHFKKKEFIQLLQMLQQQMNGLLEMKTILISSQVINLTTTIPQRLWKFQDLLSTTKLLMYMKFLQ